MRDYRGSGGFTFKKRRRVPRGLVLLLVVVILGAAVAYGLLPRMNQTAEPRPAASAPSGNTAIPLPIPGQTTPATSDEAGAR